MRNPLGWHYPAGAENDPNAPWNQTDDVPECSECGCEGGDGYSEEPFKCARCEMTDHLTEKGCKPLEDKGLKECPLCGGEAIVWIDAKLTDKHKTDFYAVGCIAVGNCGVEMVGWLKKDQMIAHWNKRAK